MIVRIINVKLTEDGFVVAYQPVWVPVVHQTVLMPAAMPPGHHLLRAGVVVDMVVYKGTVVGYCFPRELPVPPVRCA